LLTLYLQSALYRDSWLFFHKQSAITLAEAFKMQTTRYNMLLVVLFHLWECCPYLVSLVMMMQDSSSFEGVGHGGGEEWTQEKVEHHGYDLH
jgi:hypothetical protein